MYVRGRSVQWQPLLTDLNKNDNTEVIQSIHSCFERGLLDHVLHGDHLAQLILKRADTCSLCGTLIEHEPWVRKLLRNGFLEYIYGGNYTELILKLFTRKWLSRNYLVHSGGLLCLLHCLWHDYGTNEEEFVQLLGDSWDEFDATKNAVARSSKIDRFWQSDDLISSAANVNRSHHREDMLSESLTNLKRFLAFSQLDVEQLGSKTKESILIITKRIKLRESCRQEARKKHIIKAQW